MLAKYETHPESKSLGPDGRCCGRATVGLLQRRPVTVGKIVLIGKESNRLEERSRGELTVGDPDERIITYDDHDEWYRVVRPQLRDIGVRRVAQAVGMSERRIRYVLAGRALPHPRHRERLAMEAKNRLAAIQDPATGWWTQSCRSKIHIPDPTHPFVSRWQAFEM